MYFLDGKAAMAVEERLGGASGSSPVPGQQQRQRQRVKETTREAEETESRRGSAGQLLPSSDDQPLDDHPRMFLEMW